jgi:hypothetical protein
MQVMLRGLSNLSDTLRHNPAQAVKDFSSPATSALLLNLLRSVQAGTAHLLVPLLNCPVQELWR